MLEYLAERCVSPGFLAEIDVFLRGHPDLARYTPDFVHKFNNARPLAAYRFFLKGYTRPARYIPGILPDRDNDITLPHAMPSVAATVDEELVDFFDGYEYRYDILHKIDIEVATLCNGLRSGVHLTWTQRLLVTLSLFGNPVDAYKHFEYNYQTEWLPHRYLPEHVVLSELPKQEDYSEPTPRVTAPIGLPDDEVMRTHLGTRARMARACDAGVDVIDVLLEDLVAACVKRGCRRLEAQQIKQRAQAAIDCERKTSSSVDIVDLVMGMVPHAYHPRPRTAIVQHGSRRGGRGTEAKKERLRAMRRTLETLGRHEKWLAGAYEDARLYGHSGWSEFMDLRHVRETRRRVEGQFVAELAAYMFGTGAWSQYVCKDVMSRFAKGEWDTGARGGVLQLAPVDL